MQIPCQAPRALERRSYTRSFSRAQGLCHSLSMTPKSNTMPFDVIDYAAEVYRSADPDTQNYTSNSRTSAHQHTTIIPVSGPLADLDLLLGLSDRTVDLELFDRYDLVAVPADRSGKSASRSGLTVSPESASRTVRTDDQEPGRPAGKTGRPEGVGGGRGRSESLEIAKGAGPLGAFSKRNDACTARRDDTQIMFNGIAWEPCESEKIQYPEPSGLVVCEAMYSVCDLPVETL